MDAVARRLRPFGESVFTTMSRLAAEHRAVNLGQGFPDFEVPDFVRAAAKRAIDEGHGQYGRSHGLPQVTAALARHVERCTGIAYDPEREVSVVSGATEAIAAALLGMLNPGDEVVMFDPSYDSYAACVAMAGGIARRVPLSQPGFRIDADALNAACSSRTRAILFNSPHNPTGRMFDATERAAVAAAAIRHDAVVLSDEVYEQITFAGPHRSIACEPGMRERTLVISSLGKTFSCTGWKIGWTVGPAHLQAAVRAAHQFLVFCSATPLQVAAVEAFAQSDTYLPRLRQEYAARRASLLDILRGAGFRCLEPEGSYFIVAEHGHLGFGDDLTAARELVRTRGVAAIPVSAFYEDPRTEPRYLRFAFCKRQETLAEAGKRLARPATVG